MNKKNSKELTEILKQVLSNSVSYRNIGISENPCHFLFNGIEFYAYIKNLSSAHFKGSVDIWRAQLTYVRGLDEVKFSDATFIFLGYDAVNNVYATWNPFKAKQRIGTASSPSFYSRFSLQQEANSSHTFQKKVLSNNFEVLVFATELLPEYLVNIDKFFPDSSDYVAVGSRKRTEANEAYRQLTDMKSIADFERLLLSKGVNENKAHDFASAIRTLISNSIISRNRIIFLRYNSLGEYMEACADFLALNEVDILNKENNNLFSNVLPKYIAFLQGKDIICEQNDSDLTDISDASQCSNMSELEQTEWEKNFIDKQGRLTHIANPDLLNRLRPDLHTEYPSLPSAYNTVQDFYGNTFSNMEMKDWSKLFKKIDWEGLSF